MSPTLPSTRPNLLVENSVLWSTPVIFMTPSILRIEEHKAGSDMTCPTAPESQINLTITYSPLLMAEDVSATSFSDAVAGDLTWSAAVITVADFSASGRWTSRAEKSQEIRPMLIAWGNTISGSAEAEQVSKVGLPCGVSGPWPVADGVSVAGDPIVVARDSGATTAGVDTFIISELSFAGDAVAGVAAVSADSGTDGTTGILLSPDLNAVAGWVASTRPRNSMLAGMWSLMSNTVGNLTLRGAGERGVTIAFFAAATISSIQSSAARSNFGRDRSIRTRSESQKGVQKREQCFKRQKS